MDLTQLQPLLPIPFIGVMFIYLLKVLVDDRTQARQRDDMNRLREAKLIEDLEKMRIQHRAEIAEVETRCRAEADKRVEDFNQMNIWLRERNQALIEENTRLIKEVRERQL